MVCLFFFCFFFVLFYALDVRGDIDIAYDLM